MRILSTVVAVTVAALAYQGCSGCDKAKADDKKGDAPAMTDDQKELEKAAIAAYGEEEGKKKMAELIKKGKDLKDAEVEEFVKKILATSKGLNIIFPEEHVKDAVDSGKEKAAVEKVKKILTDTKKSKNVTKEDDVEVEEKKEENEDKELTNKTPKKSKK